MKISTKYIIGVMSGTSLDGIDIVYVKINAAENYSFEILKAETIAIVVAKRTFNFITPSQVEFFYFDKLKILRC